MNKKIINMWVRKQIFNTRKRIIPKGKNKQNSRDYNKSVLGVSFYGAEKNTLQIEKALHVLGEILNND